MNEIADLESWRKSLNLPKLPDEHMEKLNANPRMRQLMECMVRRIVPLDKAERARRHLILERLSDPCGTADPRFRNVEKQITNAKRRQLLEKKLSARQEEVSKYEKQAQDCKENIKAMTTDIQKLTQSIEEKEKKCSFLLLYKEELQTKFQDQGYLLDFLKKTLVSFRQRRNIVGQLIEYPAQMELKEAVKDCQNELETCLNQMKTLRSETPSNLTENRTLADKSAELKSELISFIANRLKSFPWTYILQYMLALQEETCSEVHTFLSEKSSVFQEDPEEPIEAKSLKLLSSSCKTFEADGKVKSWKDRYECIKRKRDEASNERCRKEEELQKLHEDINNKKPTIDKEMLQLIAVIFNYPEKLSNLHEKVAQLDIPQETLITSIKNLHIAVPREIKLFVEIPLISLEYFPSSGMERIKSYKCFSQFDQIPLQFMKFGSWAALLEETYETRSHKLAFEAYQQIQYLVSLRHAEKYMTQNKEKMLQEFPSIFDDLSNEKKVTEKFKKDMCYSYNLFVDILSEHEQKYYRLPEIHDTIHFQPLANVVSRDLTVQEMNIDEWLHILNNFRRRRDDSV